MYHLYHVRMSGDPARVTSPQPEPARAPVSPWPRVLARAAPGNLGPATAGGRRVPRVGGAGGGGQAQQELPGRGVRRLGAGVM